MIPYDLDPANLTFIHFLVHSPLITIFRYSGLQFLEYAKLFSSIKASYILFPLPETLSPLFCPFTLWVIT